MKKLLVSLLMLVSGFALSAQVKNYVGIVRGDISKDIGAALSDTKNGLDNKDYEKYSKAITEYLESSYGTGFVFVDKDGTNYVVTNLHVISHAKTASIEFQNDDGKSEKYNNLRVVYIDDVADVALLRFENNRNPFKRGLPFIADNVKDGDEVYTAGFPALNGEPVWQLGKGTVTNAYARIDDLIDRTVSHVIQHSGETDGGNSGGPLLVKADNSIGFAVAGINTWKATDRQSTNFSVPASLIKKVIADSKKPVDMDAQLAERKEAFKVALTKEKDPKKVMKYVSYEAAIKIGQQCFIDALNRSMMNSSKDFDAIANEFVSCPIEGFRLSIAYTIVKDFKKSETVDTDFSWVEEQGVWRIASPYTNEELEKSLKNYVGKALRNSVDVRVGTIINFETQKPTFYIGADMTFITKYVTVGFQFVPVKKGDATWNSIGGCFGVRYPVHLDAFKLTPYGKIGFMSMVSSNFGDFDSTRDESIQTSGFYEVGLNAGYRVGNFVYPGLSVGYTGLMGNKATVPYGGLNISAMVQFMF